MSAASDTVGGFKKRLREVMEEKGLTLNQVFNCDKTGWYRKLIHSHFTHFFEKPKD